MEQFLKTDIISGIVSFIPVQGERIMIGDVPCFIFEDPNETVQGTVIGWNVTMLSTGIRVAADLSKNRAIEKAVNNFKNDPTALDRAKEICIDYGFNPPINK